MQMYQYQLECKQTKQPSADLTYLLGKLQIEAAEAFQIWLKHLYHGKPLDKAALLDELGDTFWYLAVSIDELGETLEGVAEANVVKLRSRHGNKYNPAHYQAAAQATNS